MIQVIGRCECVQASSWDETEIWKLYFCEFINCQSTDFKLLLSSLIPLSRWFFLPALYHPLGSSVSLLPHISLSRFYPFLFFIWSSSLPVVCSTQPGLPQCCTVAIMSPPLSEYLPCPTDTTRCSHPPKTTSNSQRHQRPQSVSQAVSQAASKAASQRAFCFDLKLLSSQSQGCFPLLIHIKDPLKLPKFAF